MSINLHIVIDGQEVGVWQTPTYVTYMCMIDDTGRVASELRGKKARAAVMRYIQWVMSLTDGMYKSQEEVDERRQEVESYIKLLQERLDKAKTIVVYGM